MSLLSGRLPEGWRRTDLADLCDLQAGPSGAALSAAGKAEDDAQGVPLVKPRNLEAHHIVPGELDRVPEDSARRLGRYRLRPDDIVWSRAGTIGRTALVHFEQADWLFGTHLTRLRVRSPEVVVPAFLVSYLELPAVASWVQARVAGSAIPHISVATLGGLPVALPPRHEQTEFGESLGLLDQKIRVHSSIARTAQEARAALADVLFREAFDDRSAGEGD